MSPDPAPERIDFVTVGPFPEARARDLVARASRRLPLPCRLRRGPGPPVELLAGREGQVDADALLFALEADARAAGGRVVGLTLFDVASPLFTFFFGRARLAGGAAVVSLARLSPAYYGLPDDPERTAERAVTEILHEWGHAEGLPHCENARCVMRAVTDVGALDERGSAFCAECLARLPEDLRPRPSA